MKYRLFILWVLLFTSQVKAQMALLGISKDHRYFEHQDGRPFFWLGDTGWMLFSRLTTGEIKQYLVNRAAKGFNVIHASLIGEYDLDDKNRYGETVLINKDPLQPNENFFALVDSTLQWALQRQIYLALVATWGNKVVKAAGNSVIFDSVVAYKYGKWLGERFKKYSNIIWFLGGDVPVIKDTMNYISVWRAMAKGIRDGGDRHLITYHPNGYRSSSLWLHHESWLDFNAIQTSHARRDAPVWDFIRKDRGLQPVKPTLDTEPDYEDFPVNPWPAWNPGSGYFRAYDVRKQLYRCVFAGSAGVSYGHLGVFQFLATQDETTNFEDMTWTEALDRPGAWQAGYLRQLVESRPMKARVPDTALVIGENNTDDAQHIEAYHGISNDFAMVYMPIGKTIEVNTSFFNCKDLAAWWFNPRDASVIKIGIVARKTTMKFTAPSQGAENDWVLVLDNAAKKFPPPGKKK